MKIAGFAVALSVSLAFGARKVRRQDKPEDAPDGSVEGGGVRAAAMMRRNDTGTLETTLPECTCPASLWSYQSWPLINGGVGCIGGCGGTEVFVNHYGGTVQSLTVWQEYWWLDLKAIQVTYHDGHVAYFGNPSQGVNAASFTFYPGEYLVGDFRISSSWNGGRAAFMGFETSMGRRFDFGDSGQHQFRFPTGGAYLAGFSGAVGSEIDRLGAFFWKPIASIEYINLNYPTLPIPIGSPTEIAARKYTIAICREEAPKDNRKGRELMLGVFGHRAIRRKHWHLGSHSQGTSCPGGSRGQFRCVGFCDQNKLSKLHDDHKRDIYVSILRHPSALPRRLHLQPVLGNFEPFAIYRNYEGQVERRYRVHAL